MEDQIHIHFPHFRSTTPEINDDDEEEALSLRDLPLAMGHHHTTTTTTTTTSTTNHSRRSSSDPSADFFFEFLIDHHDHHPADEVIFHGRLLPLFNPPPPRRSLSLSSAAAALSFITHSPPTLPPPIRPSRSLDCRKLRRNSSSKGHTPKINSNANIRTTPKAALPWYWLVFGLPVRIPAAMELKDIKCRQLRRSNHPSRLFSGEGRNSSAAYWKLLSVLSCRNHASVDVMKTTAFHSNSIPYIGLEFES